MRSAVKNYLRLVDTDKREKAVRDPLEHVRYGPASGRVEQRRRQAEPTEGVRRPTERLVRVDLELASRSPVIG